MRVVQLMASPFYGGPERQMLGMSRHLPAECETLFLSFAEGGRAQSLIDEVRRAGLPGELLAGNFPRVGQAIAEVAGRLKDWKADVVCTSGYKPDIIGWRAARRAGIPVVVVSHGWTAATWRVRLYERLDRFVHRQANAVVAVSEAQAVRVRATGARNVTTIVNAVADDAFAEPDPAYGEKLRGLFNSPPRWIIGAAGRLSPEKGFDQLVAAAALLSKSHPDAGIAVFGDGPMRSMLETRITELGLAGKFILAGFRPDVAKYLPHLDVGTLPSFSEGLPVTLLEMMAAARPVVATAVGGIPEAITDGVTGWLVPPGDPAALAGRLGTALDDADRRCRVGTSGRETVRERFGVRRQCEAYLELFRRVANTTAQGAALFRRTGFPARPKPPRT